MKKFIVYIMWLFCIIDGAAHADQWSFPEQVEILSNNKQYKFIIVPNRRIGEVNVGSFGILYKKVAKEYKKQWIIRLVNKHSPVSGVVSENGDMVVTFDNYHRAGLGEDVIVVYGGDGALIRKYGLEDFLEEDHLKILPRSISSRSWNCDEGSIVKGILNFSVIADSQKNGCLSVRIEPRNNIVEFVDSGAEVGSESSSSSSYPRSRTMSSMPDAEFISKYRKAILEGPELIRIIWERNSDCSECSEEDILKKVLSKLELAISKGADVNELDSSGDSAFCKVGDYPEIALFLLKNGANPNVDCWFYDDPFFEAVVSDNVKLAKAMIKAGFDLDKVSSEKNDAVIRAVTFESNHVLPLLLQEGMNPNITSYGYSPLQYALEMNNWTAVDILLDHGADKSNLDIGERFLLYVYQGNIDEMVRLLDKVRAQHLEGTEEEYYNTVSMAFNYAAKSNSFRVITAMAKSGIEPDTAHGLYHITPLMQAVISDNIKTIKTLIEHGAAINLVDRYGYSALDFAYYVGSAEVIEYLLSKGAVEGIGISETLIH